MSSGVTDRDRELAQQALYVLTMDDRDAQVDNLASFFALARHEGARSAIQEMRVAILEGPLSRGIQ